MSGEVFLLRERIGEEHPFCDIGQILFIILYIVVWIIDAYWLLYTVFFQDTFHWLLRGSLTMLCIGVGVYFIQRSHNLVFDKTSSYPEIIDWGVYSIVRHPMYLGVLIFLLGLPFWSFSLLAIGILLVFFIFYDRMATYEEKDMVRVFGDDYSKYQKKVGKWIPK